MSLFITGGTGLVGSAIRRINPEVEFVSSEDYDLREKEQVKKMFDKYKPKKMLHLAAKVGGLFENINNPAELFYDNMLINTYVIHYAYKYGVEKMGTLICNCSYPDKSATYPMEESQLNLGSPNMTNYAYAMSKRATESQIKAYNFQYDKKFFCGIPCNVYGPNDQFDENKSHFVASLIKKIYDAKQNNADFIELFGSGMPLRQYLYSEDLAKILLFLLDNYDQGTPINIAPTNHFSILDITKKALCATRSNHLRIKLNTSYPDGQFRKDISNLKLLTYMDNYKFTSLPDGILKTYEWYSDKYIGESIE
jgi:GDP-L-fucose synthase